MHRSDENKVEYQVGDYQLIQYQTLQIDIIRIVCQTVERITNEILRVYPLTSKISILLTVCQTILIMLVWRIWY